MLKNYANWDSIQYWVLESDFAYPSTGKTSFHKFLCVASKDSSLGSLLIAFLLFMLRSYHYWVSPAPVIRILKYEKHCSKLYKNNFLISLTALPLALFLTKCLTISVPNKFLACSLEVLIEVTSSCLKNQDFLEIQITYKFWIVKVSANRKPNLSPSRMGHVFLFLKSKVFMYWPWARKNLLRFFMNKVEHYTTMVELFTGGLKISLCKDKLSKASAR